MATRNTDGKPEFDPDTPTEPLVPRRIEDPEHSPGAGTAARPRYVYDGSVEQNEPTVARFTRAQLRGDHSRQGTDPAGPVADSAGPGTEPAGQGLDTAGYWGDDLAHGGDDLAHGSDEQAAAEGDTVPLDPDARRRPDGASPVFDRTRRGAPTSAEAETEVLGPPDAGQPSPAPAYEAVPADRDEVAAASMGEEPAPTQPLDPVAPPPQDSTAAQPVDSAPTQAFEPAATQAFEPFTAPEPAEPAPEVVPAPDPEAEAERRRAEREYELGRRRPVAEEEPVDLPSTRLPLTTDRFPVAFALFVLRLVLAGILGIRGAQMLTDMGTTIATFSATALPFPDIFAWVTAAGSVLIAVSLVLGLLTRLGGLGALLIGAGALAFVFWWRFPFETGMAGFAGELELLVAVTGFLLMMSGGGSWGIDGVLRKRRLQRRRDRAEAELIT